MWLLEVLDYVPKSPNVLLGGWLHKVLVKESLKTSPQNNAVFFPLLVVWKNYMRDDIIVEDFQMQRYQAGIVKEASCLFIIFQSVRKHYAGFLLWKGASTVLLICKHC